MKTSRIIGFALALLMILTTMITPALADVNSGKIHVTIQVDQEARRNGLITYLSALYPDVDFDIYVGRTGFDALLQAAENGSFPDIALSGNAWGRDGVLLNDYLYNLAETDIASQFYQVYLENYSTPDGEIYWLPGCNAIEGVLANKDLFDQYGIELPTDYPSFAAACEKFTELGIRPYASDYKYNYTCAYLLQCWSIPALQSPLGKDWRISFSDGTTDTLNEDLGLSMFERLQEIFELTGCTAEDAGRGYSMTFNDFCEGRVAMIRQSTNLTSYLNSGMDNIVLLPYFGETEEDSWYFSCPSYGVAMNGELAGTGKEELVLDIVRNMFSNECLNIFAKTVQSFAAYNKGVTFVVDPMYDNIIPYIQQNHLYTYLGSYRVSNASLAAVQALIKGETDPAGALEIFNKTVVEDPTDVEVVTAFEEGYSRTWSDQGNQALSAVVNTLREIQGSDILLANSVISTSDVYADDYTLSEIGNLIRTGGTNFYQKDCTGAEIKRLVSLAVSGYGSGIDPMGIYTLPAVSGCTMKVSKAADGSYQLDDLLVNGESINDEAVYSFCYADGGTTLLTAAYGGEGADPIAVADSNETVDFETYTGFVYPARHVADFWNQYFVEGGKMIAPSDYIIVD